MYIFIRDSNELALDQKHYYDGLRGRGNCITRASICNALHGLVGPPVHILIVVPFNDHASTGKSGIEAKQASNSCHIYYSTCICI